jgi:hypothetical protein
MRPIGAAGLIRRIAAVDTIATVAAAERMQRTGAIVARHTRPTAVVVDTIATVGVVPCDIIAAGTIVAIRACSWTS